MDPPGKTGRPIIVAQTRRTVENWRPAWNITETSESSPCPTTLGTQACGWARGEASVMNAFKLFKKGSTTEIAAQVSYDAATDTATLNPTNNLRRGATYKAVVSTVAKDMAGNRLDQDASRAGLQQKVWFFTVDD